MSTEPADDRTPPFRSAEEFVASLGVERDPIRVAPAPDEDRTPVSRREAARLAAEAPAPPPPGAAPHEDLAGDGPGERPGDLGEEVARAVAYARRSTAQAPKTEARLRDKLAARELPAVVIDRAIERCRAEGIVDDPAYAKALVEERRRKGHAPFRITSDLRKRGFADDLIAQVVAPLESQDREAQAFDAARSKARSYAGLADETAYRRLVAYLARAGYPEGLARKVGREVVYADREARRTAER